MKKTIVIPCQPKLADIYAAGWLMNMSGYESAKLITEDNEEDTAEATHVGCGNVVQTLDPENIQLGVNIMSGIRTSFGVLLSALGEYQRARAIFPWFQAMEFEAEALTPTDALLLEDVVYPPVERDGIMCDVQHIMERVKRQLRKAQDDEDTLLEGSHVFKLGNIAGLLVTTDRTPELRDDTITVLNRLIGMGYKNINTTCFLTADPKHGLSADLFVSDKARNKPDRVDFTTATIGSEFKIIACTQRWIKWDLGSTAPDTTGLMIQIKTLINAARR